MRNWMKPLCAVALTLFATSAAAQEIDVQSVPLTEKAEAWLVESHDVPVITVKMAFRDAGGTSDVAGKEGRAMMLASLLNEGAGDMDALAFNQALEEHAIHLSFSADDDVVAVSMDTLTEHAGKAFELLGLALTKPRFDEDAITRVKGQMHSALRQMEEQPRYIAAKTLAETVFKGHPYANPTEGTHEGVDAVTKADLQEQLSRYITQGNLVISVVGDVDAATLQQLAKAHLAGLPVEFRPTHDVPPLEVQGVGATTTVRQDIPQTIVLFAGAGIPRDDKDFYVAYVLNHLVGGGTLTSKLGDEIREQRGLAYYAYSQLQMMDHGAMFGGGFGTRNEQAAEALRVTMQTLNDTAAGEITQAEVDEAKSYIIGAFPLVLASNDGIASMLQVMQRQGLSKDYLAERNNYIAAVTREDVIRVAERLIKPRHLTVIGVGDPAENLANYR